MNINDAVSLQSAAAAAAAASSTVNPSDQSLVDRLLMQTCSNHDDKSPNTAQQSPFQLCSAFGFTQEQVCNAGDFTF